MALRLKRFVVLMGEAGAAVVDGDGHGVSWLHSRAMGGGVVVRRRDPVESSRDGRGEAANRLSRRCGRWTKLNSQLHSSLQLPSVTTTTGAPGPPAHAMTIHVLCIHNQKASLARISSCSSPPFMLLHCCL